MQAMKEILEQRIGDIVQRVLCTEVKVIFESSERANRIIEQTFEYFELFRGSKHIPSELYFLRKSAAEPALEVADFVMHAIGRQARHSLKQPGSFVPDFCAVFHGVDRKLTSFIQVAAIAKSDTELSAAS